MTEPRGSECQCGACGQTFTGLGLFDGHQDVDYERAPVIVCAPAGLGLGLVQDARGTWGTPAGLKQRESYTRRLARARSAKRRDAA